MSHPGSSGTGPPGPPLARGKSTRAFQPTSQEEQQPSDTESMTFDPEGDPSGAMRGRGAYRPFITKPSGITQTFGSGGKAIRIQTNYFRVRVPKGEGLYQYNVEFSPQVDNIRVRRALVYSEAGKLGRAYIFDGMSDLKTLDEVEPHNQTLSAVRATDNAVITMQLSHVGNVGYGSFEMLRFYNTQMRRNLLHLGMQQIGRNYFDRRPLGEVRNFYGGIEVLQGVQTAINNHDGGLLLMVDNNCKFMRKQNARDVLLQLNRDARSNFPILAKKELVGSIVMSKTNNKTYKIDDINFGANPTNTFTRGNEEISYIDYYKQQYGKEIRDERQPLLMVLPTQRDKRAGRDQNIYLVPELCTMTGLTDEMRKNFSFMKSVAQWTKQAPGDRAKNILTFMQRVNSNESVKKELDSWSIQYGQNLVETGGRVLNAPTLALRNDTIPIENADFSRAMSGKAIVDKVQLKKWAWILHENERRAGDLFTGEVQKISARIGIECGGPIKIQVDRNGNSQDWVQAIDKVPEGAQVIVCFVANQSKDRYDAIKKATIIKKKVASQVITANKLLNAKNASAIVFKILYQICAKANGVLWRLVNMPKNVMVAGYDTYHDSSQKGRSAGAFVASCNPTFARWFSRVNLHTAREELSGALAQNIVLALKFWYNKNNNELPSNLIIYRDGVGEGNIRYVFEYEVKQVKQALAAVPGGNNLKLTFIIVSKRVNARLFAMGSRGHENCPPGTIVDKDITRPDRYDFYLTSQTVREGTVNPTMYDIICDESRVKPEMLQNLTYSLTHLYYNWQGTIKVPAPCQYAHKLAFMVGQHLHEEHSSQMDHLLWYL